MKAAGLKAIDTVVESTAVLITSKHPSNQKLVDIIRRRIEGFIGTFDPDLSSSSPQRSTYMF
jgi:ATP phosphoribosyltransferase